KVGDIGVMGVCERFIVVSFLKVMKVEECEVREKERRKEDEDMVMIVWKLYEERIDLKKRVKTREDVRKEWYQVYGEMRGKEGELGSGMVGVGGEIDEVKKENQ
uniref:hypothetical protein n=1 Tax=Bacillus velezensis TaxID=492670 RepID=UPI0037C0E7D7